VKEQEEEGKVMNLPSLVGEGAGEGKSWA